MPLPFVIGILSFNNGFLSPHLTPIPSVPCICLMNFSRNFRRMLIYPKMTPDLMDGGAEFLAFYNCLQIQKRIVFHNFTQPYHVTEMWFLEVDARQQGRLI